MFQRIFEEEFDLEITVEEGKEAQKSLTLHF